MNLARQELPGMKMGDCPVPEGRLIYEVVGYAGFANLVKKLNLLHNLLLNRKVNR